MGPSPASLPSESYEIIEVIVLSDSDVGHQPRRNISRNIAGAEKRLNKRDRSNAVAEDFCAHPFSSTDAAKEALKANNPACVPRLRATHGKYVRFGYKFAGSHAKLGPPG